MLKQVSENIGAISQTFKLYLEKMFFVLFEMSAFDVELMTVCILKRKKNRKKNKSFFCKICHIMKNNVAK